MRLLSTTALMMTLATASHALTPAEVWETWEPMVMMTNPTDINVVQTPSGLVIENMTWSEGSEALMIPQMNILQEGTDVYVTFPSPIMFSAPDGTGSITINNPLKLMDAEQAGMFGNMAAAWNGSITGTITDTTENFAAQMAFNNMVLQAPEGQPDGSAMMVFNAGPMTMSAEGANGERFSFNSTWSKSTVKTSNAALLHAGDPIAAIAQGTNIGIETKQGPGTYTLISPMDDMNISSSWGNGQGQAGIDRQGAYYTFAMDGMSSMMQSNDPDMPNVTTKTDKAAGSLSIPLFASNQDQNAVFNIFLENFQAEMASMPGVPAAALELLNEPMTLKLESSATVMLTDDVWPSSMMDQEAPITAGTLKSVQIDDITLSIGDTTVNGVGALMMAGSTFATLMPAMGEGTVTLTGAAPFLQKLVNAELITDQDRGMAEMMMRGFAKPGEVDPLSYTLKLLQTGEITINGNPF